jgi:hypothetical protein
MMMLTCELHRFFLGSARASRAGFGASPKQSSPEKVHDGEGAIVSTRGARAPQRNADAAARRPYLCSR